MILIALFLFFFMGPVQAEPVRFAREKCILPTYTFERIEDVAPLFGSLENMGHYPYTVVDWNSRGNKPVPIEYESLVLENEVLRVEFLPEFGGRIWSAYDKRSHREIFYRPTVVKPGRYNQRSAWPVGNLELYGPYDAHMLTWPGEPWAWDVRQHDDGRATVTLSHIDHFFRDKISLVVTMHPERSFLETEIRLHNKNLFPNRYLLWTNAGVAVTEGSRFVYPMTRTIGHDSSSLADWPLYDGKDLSWNRNNASMLGVFGLDIYDDFMSIYDYRQDYGTICTANRLLARGIKTWTFGSGLTAERHRTAYTDTDGLYMEMQSGRFIWDGNYEFIDPGKTDSWTEYWYGAGDLGGLTTANRDVAVFLQLPDRRPGNAQVAVTATGSFPRSVLELWADGQKVWSSVQDLEMRHVFRAAPTLTELPGIRQWNLRIRTREGSDLLNYTVHTDGSHPEAVYAQDSIPRDYGAAESLSIEELYRKGLAEEKFGRISKAEEAYRLALARDALFSPVQLRLGLLAMERFEESKAFSHFQKVLERDPTSGEAHYFLGILEADRGHILEAKRHYYRILPSSSRFERRDYMLALAALQEGDGTVADRTLAHAVAVAPMDLSIRQSSAYRLRKRGRMAEAIRERESILQQDPTNAFSRSEQLFLESASEKPRAQTSSISGESNQAHTGAISAARQLLDQACAGHPQGYIELATEYMRLSAWEEAGKVLELGLETAKSSGKSPDPLLYYYRAFIAGKEGKADLSSQFLADVSGQELHLNLFPFRYEDLRVLEYARKHNAKDTNASVLLADLLYSRNRQQEAIAIWQQALATDPRHFLASRDLGLALFTRGDAREGLDLITRASSIRPTHLATTMLTADLQARFGNIEAARESIQRTLKAYPGKDVLLEKLSSLEAQVGNSAIAMEILLKHNFEPAHQTYHLLHLYRGIRLLLAQQAAAQNDSSEALGHMQAAAQPHAGLGIDDFATVPSSRLLLHKALLLQFFGQKAEAVKIWQSAAATRDDDIEGEGLFRAIALDKTGQKQSAMDWIRTFRPINEQRKTDSSVPLRLHAHCLSGYLAAFEGKDREAEEHFSKALDVDQSYLYARQGLAWLKSGLLKELRQ